jgi:hypothetical protein
MRVTKPTFFTISATWDHGAAVWTGQCDAIPAAADAPTLDEFAGEDVGDHARPAARQPSPN